MTRLFALGLSALVAVFCLPVMAAAQTSLSLGGLAADPAAPIEITAAELNVDQTARRAVFAGDVLVIQGELRLSAGRVEVTYAETGGEITALDLSGGITFVTATEAAEAQSARYDIAGGQLVLTGNVLVTQGPAAIAADSMVLNLADGTAQMQGNVRTTLVQGN